MNDQQHSQPSSIFDSAEWYDVGINWDARLRREIPVLRDVMGPPGELGLLDAGCGTGHQAIALAQAGYRVTALDASKEMLRVAAQHAAAAAVNVSWVRSPYETMVGTLNRSFDGVYCLANALAAAGTAEAVRQSVYGFATVLRTGGRLFLQVLNFDAMRREQPCVRGPRVREHEGTEYVSTRSYRIEGNRVDITSLTMWKESTWRLHARSAQLYAISFEELEPWLADAGLRIDAAYGDYRRCPFDPEHSDDLIVVATKT